MSVEAKYRPGVGLIVSGVLTVVLVYAIGFAYVFGVGGDERQCADLAMGALVPAEGSNLDDQLEFRRSAFPYGIRRLYDVRGTQGEIFEDFGSPYLVVGAVTAIAGTILARPFRRGPE